MLFALSAQRARCAFVSLCALVSCGVNAADDAVLGQVVVTASRAPMPLSKVGDSITVLTAEEVRATQKLAVADVLSATPGVSVTRNGGLGSTASVRIRGAEAEQTVVLIDGIKLNDPGSAGGGFNFGNLMVNDIARIEVLRGSQSTLWGSQAIGGVVNIVTTEPTGPLQTAVDAQGGSFATARFTARAQSGNERLGWRVGGSYLTTDGASAFDERLGGREDDGYRNVGANARGIVHLTDAIAAEIRSTWSRGRNEFDGFPPPSRTLADTPEYGTTEEWVNYAGVTIDSFASRWQHRVGVAYTDTQRENFNPASTVPLTLDAEGSNLRYDYQGTIVLNEHLSGVFGVERERSDIDSASPTTSTPNPVPLQRDVTIDSVYAQLNVAPIEALTLSAGLRYDDHETFGNNTTSQYAIAWSVTQAATLRASMGQGFKAPTLYQLYSQYGTAALEPEESSDWDVGVEQKLFDTRVVLSATYFKRDTDNMIDFVSCSGVSTPRCAAQPGGYYENISQTTADGYEFALAAQLGGGLSLNANYTALDARDDSRSTANSGKQLARRPRDAAALELAYAWPIDLTTSVAARYVGDSFDTAANTFVLEEYTLVDLRANYRVSDRWEVYGRVENLLDEQYQTTRRYGSLGRGAYVGARATW